MFREIFFGIGPFAFIALSFFFDYKRLSILKAFALENQMPVVSLNPFKSSASALQIKKSLPNGPILNVRRLEIISALCWFAFAAILFIPFWNKYVTK